MKLLTTMVVPGGVDMLGSWFSGTFGGWAGRSWEIVLNIGSFANFLYIYT